MIAFVAVDGFFGARVPVVILMLRDQFHALFRAKISKRLQREASSLSWIAEELQLARIRCKQQTHILGRG
jgi:hypothetical protein